MMIVTYQADDDGHISSTDDDGHILSADDTMHQHSSSDAVTAWRAVRFGSIPISSQWILTMSKRVSSDLIVLISTVYTETKVS